ncbi:hypothetical protein VdG2_02926 [Verticillium dahliae VDG2]|nr:hypothetical protein VdG2_02926 [Verticillium dahliae VDG2]
MASFAENLWNSVFTPGTTPTLLYATNASFAALQLTLLALLAATRSIHFIVLSFLCAGLWRAINCASREVEVEGSAAGELKQRSAAAAAAASGPASAAGTQSSASTEDEWEKVSENENEKDK